MSVFKPKIQEKLNQMTPMVREQVVKLIENLNDEQQEGALHGKGAMLITAGAGAGKTRTLIQRTAVMLTMGIPASELLMVTFTQKAALEIKLRLQDQIGQNAQYITAGTFHSIIYARILKANAEHPYLRSIGYDFTQTSILEPSDSDKAYKEAYKELPSEDLIACEENEWEVKDIIKQIASYKSSAMDEHDLLQQLSPKDKNYEFIRICVSVWHSYTQKCKAANGIDFDDILVVAAKFLLAQPEIAKQLSLGFTYIMLDEYQDTNPVQQIIMDAIAINHCNVLAVGDEKQSIYGFRNADVTVMLGMPKRYPDCILLNMNRNYRSNPLIIQWANACAKTMHESQRLTDGQLRAESKLPPKEPTVVEFANDDQEAEILVKAMLRDKSRGVPGKDIAVLYRSRNVKTTLERMLVEKGVEYMVVGDTSFYQRAEVKDALAMLRSIFRPWDQMAILRVVKASRLGVSPESIKSAIEENGVTASHFLQLQSERRLKGTGKNAQGEYASSAKKLRPFLQICQEVRDGIAYGDSPEFIKETISALWDIYLLPKIANSAKKNAETENSSAIDDKIKNVFQVFDNLQKGLEKGMNIEEVLDEFSMMSEEHPDMDRSNDQKIRLMTIHASKGLEFQNVYIIGMDNHTYKDDLPFDEAEEEIRNAYVGLTRAQRQLVMTYCKNRVVFGESMQLDKATVLKNILHIVNKRVVSYSQQMAQRGMEKTG